MSWHRISRKYHKWLMLFVGLQFVIWSISGAYMVIFDIDYIHGDSLVVEQQKSLQKEQVQYSIAELYRDYPYAENIELVNLLGQAVYRFSSDNEQSKTKYLLSADDGKLLSPITERYAVQIAKSLYENPKVDISRVSLISDEPPFELSARHLPVWRVDFDYFASPSFYISVQTGQLVTKRHTYWRLFDWMFSFHVMDYVEEDASNKLLLVVSSLALIASLFGTALIYFRVFKSNNTRSRKQKVRKSV
ncbi:MAG: PepSY domain-containing protein [Colwellia sp.]|nr:PepSY domain-containing protein [Colwellia sp.]MCW8863931.1 PepSY domain-containing protein [Colwellia sp.]MCW9082197.1 PepSY domain-containing protein [Colwellia sp.]